MSSCSFLRVGVMVSKRSRLNPDLAGAVLYFVLLAARAAVAQTAQDRTQVPVGMRFLIASKARVAREHRTNEK